MSLSTWLWLQRWCLLLLVYRFYSTLVLLLSTSSLVHFSAFFDRKSLLTCPQRSWKWSVYPKGHSIVVCGYYQSSDFHPPHQAVILTKAAQRSTFSGKCSLQISQQSVLEPGKIIPGPTRMHPWWLLPDKCSEKKSTPTCRPLQIESGVCRGQFSHQRPSKYLWKEEYKKR